MHIFIDESGGFVVPATQSAPNMCVVAALAVSEQAHAELVKLHAQLVAHWKPPGAEIKARDLNEWRFRRAFRELQAIDVVPAIVAIDMSLQTEDSIARHKVAQAEKLRESVSGPEFYESFRKSVHELADRVQGLSNQLYVQSFVQTEAINRVFRVATLHYAQTDPAALGAFAWRIDAKDRTKQECERLWEDLLKPSLQTMSLGQPHIICEGEGFDYSAMAAFENPVRDAAPPHLAVARGDAGGPFHSSDLRKILEDMQFADSRSSIGIQFADVLAGAFRRACNGRLREPGWKPLGPLLIKHVEDRLAVSYITVTKITQSPDDFRYARVVREMERSARYFHVHER